MIGQALGLQSVGSKTEAEVVDRAGLGVARAEGVEPMAADGLQALVAGDCGAAFVRDACGQSDHLDVDLKPRLYPAERFSPKCRDHRQPAGLIYQPRIGAAVGLGRACVADDAVDGDHSVCRPAIHPGRVV